MSCGLKGLCRVVLCHAVLSYRCGCLIGKDYPYPIVDHTAISKVNMARMKVGVYPVEAPF
jgi:hypothetical protein